MEAVEEKAGSAAGVLVAAAVGPVVEGSAAAAVGPVVAGSAAAGSAAAG